MQEQILGQLAQVLQERVGLDAEKAQQTAQVVLEFARKGLHGASTEDIARMAGISQPYLFRLFGTKKALYLATATLQRAEAIRFALEHLEQLIGWLLRSLRQSCVAGKLSNGFVR